MNEELRYHLWIPEEEVEKLDKTLRNFSEDRGLDYGQHGATLSQGLQNVLQAYEHLQNDSLSDEDIIIFKMQLPEGQDIYGQRTNLEKEGLKINAVKDKRHAIVSTNRTMFQRMTERVGTYRQTGALKHFQYIDNFQPYTQEDKQASSLKKYLEEQKDILSVDVQMMFVPNLDEEVQDRAAERITGKITQLEGEHLVKKYKLSDGTTVIRANFPIKNYYDISNDSAIYRVEQTGFFRIFPSATRMTGMPLLQLDPNTNPLELPTVAVLDSGVDFPDEYKALVPVQWKATGVSGIGSAHGTEVASKVIFSHIGLYLTEPYISARAKVIDCDIYGSADSVSQEDMAKRIEEAVDTFHDVAKIYNLSSNIPKPIDGDELSILGYQLDSLMKKYHVKFVISAGNHELAATCSTLEEILDDTDARIAEPADSMLGITVGAIAGSDGPNVFSKRGEPTAYTRVGPGFAGYYKPDLVAYGANLHYNGTILRDPFAYVLTSGGQLGLDAGTSFTAPVVAGDLAQISNVVPNNDILLAQALLYNGTEKIWDTSKMTKEDAIYLGNQYGRGLSVPEKCMYSSTYRVSFMRTGSLKKATKERVRFVMPQVQAALKGNNNTKVTVTCITDAPIDRTKGEQYLGACITASLHKLDGNGTLANGNPKVSDNKGKWDTCNHFCTTFSKFSSGTWEVWLDLFAKWDIDDDMEIPYALVVTIEDMTRTNDIYQAVLEESAGRFQPITPVRVPVHL